MIKARIEKLQEKILNAGLSAFLVTNSSNIYYLTGFRGISPEERESLLLVDREAAYLCVPPMYRAEAGQIHGEVKVRIPPSRTKLLDFMKTQFKKYVGKVGFEAEDLKYSEYLALRKKIKHLQAKKSLVTDLREVKDADELRHIKKAVRIADQAFEEILRSLRPGLTEKQIARKLLEIMEDLGSEDAAFPPIIASGKGSALPHHRTSHKKIKKGEPVLLDFGAKVNGYCSDLTRVVYVGKAPRKFRKHYNLVLKTQKAVINSVRPRLSELTAEKLHQTALNVLGRQAKFMLHGVGHGIGLEVHEKPFLRAGTKDKLREGMVITIEPGLYYEGRYGIRIEDFGVVTKSGFQILSKAKKELTEL